jgi:hypothetical protein
MILVMMGKICIFLYPYFFYTAILLTLLHLRIENQSLGFRWQRLVHTNDFERGKEKRRRRPIIINIIT